jgi:hypothetical protein
MRLHAVRTLGACQRTAQVAVSAAHDDPQAEAVAWRVETLHTIAQHLRQDGRDGWASNLAEIAKFIKDLNATVNYEVELRRMLAERYATWTPPPPPVIREVTTYATGERIKGDM